MESAEAPLKLKSFALLLQDHLFVPDTDKLYVVNSATVHNFAPTLWENELS